MESKNYWDERYLQGDTGWDIGAGSAPLIEYIKQIEQKDLAILVPGCGNAHEAAMMLSLGFTNITLVDISEVLVNQLKQKFTGQPIRILHQDFFRHEGAYDLVLEQTFFCAIDPSMRQEYAKKMHSLLKPGGKLVGVLFDKEFEGGPPFSGNRQEYETVFSPLFHITKMEPCYNSIPKRQGSELFVILEKK